ncbi:DUF4282 domain-containing protein [Spirillospora sp. CA-108201]
MRTAPYRRFNRSPLRLLFSADYSEFVTTRVITTGYRMVITATVIAVTSCSWIGLSVAETAGWGVAGLICISATFCGLATLTAVRVSFEFLLVVFDIAETLHRTDRKPGDLTRIAHNERKEANRAQNEQDHTTTG